MWQPGSAKRNRLGTQGVRRIIPHRFLVLLVLLLVPIATQAAQPAARTLLQPQRLTAGDSDEFLGQLSPDAHKIYFVSNRNATTEVFSQDLRMGGATRLFDDGADVSYPRISPNGKLLLYISYRVDSGGDACVRNLETGKTSCNRNPDSSEIQAFWFPDSAHYGCMSRTKFHGDLSLRKHKVGSTGEGEVLLKRNLSSPAISPQGTWLAAVPVERTSEHVGVSFSMRSLGSLEFKRLDKKSEAQRLRFKLPGLSGFPIFSKDGRFIYFSQYLNDTNFDGVIDGNDNSVLFRAPFNPKSEQPVQGASVEQLTSARWNCQYPSPATDALIMTCKRRGSLDIYRLPLDGAVPASWTDEKLREDLHAARNPWQRLLILSRILNRKNTVEDERRYIRQMTHLHLGLGEYESAVFYAQELSAKAENDDQALWAKAMVELIAHRREEERITQGEFNDAFVRDQRRRFLRLQLWASKTEDPSTVLLIRTVASEVLDSIGDLAGAEKEMEAAKRQNVRDPVAIHLWVERVGEFYRVLGRIEKVEEALAEAAQHNALDLYERMIMARRFAEHITQHGEPGQRAGRIAAWLKKLPPESELAFVLSVLTQLQKLSTENQEKVREEVFELYRGTKQLPKRQGLVDMTIDAAARKGNPYLLYEFSNSWVSYLKRAHSERPHAEMLYRDVVLERGYLEHKEGDFSDARGFFFGLTLQADILEAHIGFIENRFLEGKDDVLKAYEKKYRKDPDKGILHFVRAYIRARNYRKLTEREDRLELITDAIKALSRTARDLPKSPEVHHLLGTMYHFRFLESGNTNAAVDGQAHYLLALDLASANPRYRAPLLQQLGQLQSAVGNHYRAVERFVEREKLPFSTISSELNLKMMKARSQFHSGRAADAVQTTREVQSLVENNSEGAKYLPWVLNRLGFYLYSSASYSEALSVYTLSESKGLLPQGEGDVHIWNLIRHRTMKGASAMAAEALEIARQEFEEARADLKTVDQSSPAPFGTPGRRGSAARHSVKDQEIILLGLQTQLSRKEGNWKRSIETLKLRRELIAKRYGNLNRPQDLAELAHSSYGLASIAWKTKDFEAVKGHLEKGLAEMDIFNEENATLLHPVTIQLVRGYAALHFYGRIPLESLSMDLPRRLGQLYDELCLRNNPKWDRERFVLGIYRSMLRLRSKD